MIDKLRFLVIPFLLVLFALLVGYSLLYWAIFIELKLFNPKMIIPQFVIPMTLAGLSSWIFLRPRLKILRLGKRDNDWRLPYTGIAWLLLAFPLIFAHSYVTKATGKLSELNSIHEINQTPATKYYTLKNYYIDKRLAVTGSRFNVTGKYSEDFRMHIYFAVPIFESSTELSSSEVSAWMGIDYHKAISNRLDSTEKDTEYFKFFEESKRNFDSKNISEFVYLDRIANSDDRDGYINTIKKHRFYKPSEHILIRVNQPFEARIGNLRGYLRNCILIGIGIWLPMVLIPPLDQKQLERIKAGKPDKEAQQERKEFYEFLKPQGPCFITPILVYINTGIFLLMVIAGLGFIDFRGQDLLKWGANYGPLVKEGEWWRLFTSTFLHGGLLHLCANMYGLFFIGIFLEPLLGRIRYLAAYLLSGILASAASIWWHDATISVGASGAIFGLYGLALAMQLTGVLRRHFPKILWISIALFVGINLLFGLMTGSGIDNAAHIGGLLAGFVIGLILRPTLKANNNDPIF